MLIDHFHNEKVRKIHNLFVHQVLMVINFLMNLLNKRKDKNSFRINLRRETLDLPSLTSDVVSDELDGRVYNIKT